MKLSTKGRYGLRAMFALAKSYGEGPLPLGEVAMQEAISEAYLEQLVLTLRRTGLVRSVRGAQGDVYKRQVQGCGFKVFADALAGGGSVRAIVLEGQSLARKELDRLGELVKTYHAKGLAWAVLGEDGVRSPIAKFFSEEQFAYVCQAAGAKTGDTLLMVADANDTTVCTALGQLRLELGRRFGLIDESKFNFLWVTEFPLLEWDEEVGRFSACLLYTSRCV